MYQRVTRGIAVTVEPAFLEEQSEPDQGRYAWAYHIKIENRGLETVQLLTRHWRITDGRGEIVEVEGDGVIGEQPVLGPGGQFEYTSGTPLPTPTGFMVGSYGMETEAGELFRVEIPAFSLDSPYQKVAIN